MSENGLLKRVLGLPQVIGIEIGTTIGAGIFVFTGIAMAMTGSGLPIAYFIAVLPIIFSMFPIAMLGSALPTVGGTYRYPSRMLSPGFAFFAVWAYILGAFMGFFPLYAINCVEYFQNMIPGWHLSSMEIKIAAAGLILFFYLVNVLGVSFSSWIQAAMVGLLLLGLLLYVIIGLPEIKTTNLSDMFAKGADGILVGASLLTFTYLGSNSIIELGGEIKNPGRVIPLSLMITFPILIVFYVLVGLVSVGVLPWMEVAGKPLTQTAHAVFNSSLFFYFFGAAALLAIATTLNATFIWGTKSLIILCTDGIFPPRLAAINKRFATPHIILTIIAVISIGVIFIDFDQELLTVYATIGGLMIFLPVLLTAYVFPERMPDAYAKAPFKIKGFLLKLSVFIGVLLCTAAMGNLLAESFLRPQNADFTVDSTTPFTYDLYLCPVGYEKPINEMLFLSREYIQEEFSLSEGEEITLTGNVMLPNQIPPNEYYLYTHINPDFNIKELSILDNTDSNYEEIKVDSEVDPIDVGISSVDLAQSLGAGQTLSFSIQYISQGIAVDQQINLNITLWHQQGNFSIPLEEVYNIFPSSNVSSFTNELTIPSDIPTGSYDVVFQLSPPPEEYEIHLENNHYRVESVVIQSPLDNAITINQLDHLLEEDGRFSIAVETQLLGEDRVRFDLITNLLVCARRNAEDPMVLLQDSTEIYDVQLNSNQPSKTIEMITDGGPYLRLPESTYQILGEFKFLIYPSDGNYPESIRYYTAFFDFPLVVDNNNLFPDLTLVAQQTPDRIEAGMPLEYSITIENKKGNNIWVLIYFVIWVAAGMIYYYIRRYYQPQIKSIYGKQDF